MREYTFYAYFFDGTGKIFSLSDWTFSSDNCFFTHNRGLKDSDFVEFVFDKTSSGMHQVHVVALGVKEAIALLRYSLAVNNLDLVVSTNYNCVSNGIVSKRILRSSLLSSFDSV